MKGYTKGIEKEQDQMKAPKATAKELYQIWFVDNGYLFTPEEAGLILSERPESNGQIKSMSATAVAAPDNRTNTSDYRTESEGPNYSGQ
jgi:hypothetical protein